MQLESTFQTTKKRYLTVKNNNHVEFPHEFINSINPKWIVVRNCKALYRDTLVGDIELHADFIKRDHDCNYFVMFANELQVKPKKYEYLTNESTFNIWFEHIDGSVVAVDEFVLELLLMY